MVTENVIYAVEVVYSSSLKVQHQKVSNAPTAQKANALHVEVQELPTLSKI